MKMFLAYIYYGWLLSAQHLSIDAIRRQVRMSNDVDALAKTELDIDVDEVATLNQLVITRTRERDDVIQQRTQDRKAFDAERQELRREISALRHENEHSSEVQREIDQLKRELATTGEHAAESEQQLIEIRKQHAEAMAAAAKKTDALEICVQELSKDVEKLNGEKQQLLKDLEQERARTAAGGALPKELPAGNKPAETARVQAGVPGRDSAVLLHHDPEIKQAIDVAFGGTGMPARDTASRLTALTNGGAPPAPAPPDAGPKPVVRDTWSNLFRPQTGTWTVEDQRYQAAPAGEGDAISLLQLNGPLPADLLIEVTANAASPGGRNSNAFVIFDYRGPTEFKYAGFRALAKKWVIGQRQDAKWLDLATVVDALVSGADYRFRLSLRGSTAQLIVNGVAKGTCDFSVPLNGGGLGLATQGSLSQFEKLSIQNATPSKPA
jgi:hypothetical protein